MARKRQAETLDIHTFKHSPGVHLNMPEDIYFSIDALGSSDLKPLLRDPASWWYGSRHNPDRGERKRDQLALVTGSALHSLLLEGEDAYLDNYAVAPDPAEHPDAKSSAVDIRDMLKANGVHVDTYNEQRLIDLARKHKLEHYVWPIHVRRHKYAVSKGKPEIKRDLDRRLRHMAELVNLHPDLGPGLKKGLTEVTVLFTLPEFPGVLLRSRFDKLTVSWSLDLKTIGNWYGREVGEAVRKEIAQREYDIQRALYDLARKALRKAVSEKRIYAWDNEGVPCQPLSAEMVRLQEIAKADSWVWVWLFYQVRNDDPGKERAPVVAPRFHRPKGVVFDQANQKVIRALENYESFKDRYGLNTPWAVIEQITELEDSDLSDLQWKGLPA